VAERGGGAQLRGLPAGAIQRRPGEFLQLRPQAVLSGTELSIAQSPAKLPSAAGSYPHPEVGEEVCKASVEVRIRRDYGKKEDKD